MIIARRNHPRVKGKKISRAKFFAESHVVVDLEDEQRQIIDRVLSEAGRRRRVLAAVGEYTSVPSVVIQSDALALVPRSMAASPVFAAQLQVLEPPIARMSLPLGVYWHEGFEADPGHSWLRELVTQRFWS